MAVPMATPADFGAGDVPKHLDDADQGADQAEHGGHDAGHTEDVDDFVVFLSNSVDVPEEERTDHFGVLEILLGDADGCFHIPVGQGEVGGLKRGGGAGEFGLLCQGRQEGNQFHWPLVGIAHERFADAFNRAPKMFPFRVKNDGGERAAQDDHDAVQAQKRDGGMGEV